MAASGTGGTLLPAPWNLSPGKRLFDFIASILLLLLTSPLLLAVALAVKLTSRGPILYRQSRVGQGGCEFSLLKFRTMVQEQRAGAPCVTRFGDPRITPAGRILRQWKLDELPQLLNVLKGEMSFVGPRPDVSEYIATLDAQHRQILSLRPGLTGAATLRYRHEEQLLSQVPETELKQFYCTQVLPEKVGMDLEYARGAGLLSDLVILAHTVGAIFS
jgi:lipopolysaccharide/colanic/teichoic acid biosynthesis glycosyltransferase